MVVAQKDRDRSQERTMRLPDDGSLSETGTRVNLRFGKRLEKNGISTSSKLLRPADGMFLVDVNVRTSSIGST